ncbi:FxLD family lanthipeptide [Pilimelia anulata]|uniref:FxLD family lanthipeptide n=1 Tax=Pilimelia anulata TaxID=53371 RepID=UPI001E3D2455|nr:FxLD family lanthipeptide [Pilimelia anulata]
MQLETAPITIDNPNPVDTGEWDLDVSFIEAGDSVKHLIYMTNDNCGQTCASACVSCP